MSSTHHWNPTKTTSPKFPLPPIQGRVQFEGLNFAFEPGKPSILKNINFNIEPGTFTGIVGQSGSGKVH